MFVLWLTAACSTAPPPRAVAPAETPGAVAMRTVDVATLAGDREAGRVPLLMDVRTPQEFAGGHIPGAINVPLSELDSRADAVLAGHEGEEIYLVCQSGRRSARAGEALTARGVATVNVAGGTGAWIAAGHPTEP